jgi:LPS-assembly lipoprotein
MSSSRAIALLLLLSLLGACGYSPVYERDETSAVADQLAQIKILSIPDRVGQLLHNDLLEKLTPRGQPAKPRYILKVNLVETVTELGIRKDDLASRANLNLRTNFVLYDGAGKVHYFQSLAMSTSSFNMLTNHFASTIARKDAEERAVLEVSQSIKNQLAAFLSRQDEAQASK